MEIPEHAHYSKQCLININQNSNYNTNDITEMIIQYETISKHQILRNLLLSILGTELSRYISRDEIIILTPNRLHWYWRMISIITIDIRLSKSWKLARERYRVKGLFISAYEERDCVRKIWKWVPLYTDVNSMISNLNIKKILIVIFCGD